MTILSAQSIRMIKPVDPFYERQIGPEGLSFGLGPASYDVRIEFDPSGEIVEDHIFPGQFKLASTIEYFRMPMDIGATVHDKSTWARRGLAVQNTWIDPGWQGYLTLELTNHGVTPIHIFRGTPIAQIVFHKLDEPTLQPYGSQGGKYQFQQRGPQVPR